MHALIRTKTFWAAVSAIVTALGAYFTGDISLSDAIQTVATGAIGICLRHGMIGGRGTVSGGPDKTGSTGGGE